MRAHSLQFRLLVLLFAAPFIAGWLFLLNPAWLPGGGGGANHGELIRPVRSVADLTLSDPQGQTLALASLKGNWVLLFATGACGDECRRMLWKMRQVRRALGTGRERVHRLLLLEEPLSEEMARRLPEKYPRMMLAHLPADAEARPNTGAGLPQTGDEALFVIDPMGNLMMRYPPEAPAEHILDDMERLLKVSEHWETQ